MSGQTAGWMAACLSGYAHRLLGPITIMARSWPGPEPGRVGAGNVAQRTRYVIAAPGRAARLTKLFSRISFVQVRLGAIKRSSDQHRCLVPFSWCGGCSVRVSFPRIWEGERMGGPQVMVMATAARCPSSLAAAKTSTPDRTHTARLHS